MKCKIVSIIALLAVMVALTGAASATSARWLEPDGTIQPIFPMKNNQIIHFDLQLDNMAQIDLQRIVNATLQKFSCTDFPGRVEFGNCDLSDFDGFLHHPQLTITTVPLQLFVNESQITMHAPLSRKPGTLYSFSGDVSGFAPPDVTAAASLRLQLVGSFISGKKCNDLNGHGTLCDQGEPGLPGWTIILRDENGTEVNRTTTDANGNYIFMGPFLEGAFIGFRGNFTVEEVHQAGWIQTGPPDPGTYSITVDANNVTDLNFSNNQKSTIIVVKNTIGGDGTFNYNTTGGDGFPPSLSITTSGGIGKQIFTNITPGNYSISEIVPSGWTLTSSDCGAAGSPASFVAPPGGIATCTFNNTITPGKIIVVKNTVGGDGTFNYTTTGGDGFPSSLSLTTSNGTVKQTFDNITPGTYSINETVPSNWSLTSSSCDVGTPSGFVVPAGGTVTCTFNNAKQQIEHPGKAIGWGDLGSKASFKFWVKSAFLSSGTMSFTDKINKVEIKATRIDSMTTQCNELACTTFPKSGTMKGMADVTENGAFIGNFAFTVNVVDNADPSHGKDTFSISVPDYKPSFMPSGYSMSGAGTFGNLEVIQTS